MLQRGEEEEGTEGERRRRIKRTLEGGEKEQSYKTKKRERGAESKLACSELNHKKNTTTTKGKLVPG